MPSVTFAPSADDTKRPPQKRPREHDLKTEEETSENEPGTSVGTRKQKRYRPNEDEIDDIDEWQQDEDDNEDHVPPSEKELLDAKRQRRQSRSGINTDEKTRIDDVTSLAAEGIAIEPFHMKNEESDGTGFFDGDTYVFRRKNAEEGEDDEPDAWLDRLREDEQEGKRPYQIPVAKAARAEAAEAAEESMDDLTKDQLYLKILPLLNEHESVSQALIRYGRLMRPTRTQKVSTANASQSATQDSAKALLNELTGAASALLLKGEVEIYQSSKMDIQRLLPSSQVQSAAKAKSLIEKQQPAKWEYMGNQDGALHGPYTTEQMMEWVKAGYFVGAQRVKVRTIREEARELSTQDDLLADLLDDDGNDEECVTPPTEGVMKKGDWMWSNEIDYGAYLPEPNC